MPLKKKLFQDETCSSCEGLGRAQGGWPVWREYACRVCDGSGVKTSLIGKKVNVGGIGDVDQLYPGILWSGLPNGNVYVADAAGELGVYMPKLKGEQYKPWIEFLKNVIAAVKRGERKRKRDKR